MALIFTRTCTIFDKANISWSHVASANFLRHSTFVPECESVKAEDIKKLKKFFDRSGKICVLTGAGVSTESGIPDYRSAGVGLFATSTRRPMAYQEFCGSSHAQKRYWARNYAAWTRFSKFQPNFTHKWLKDMEDRQKVSCVVTQNVDSLHLKAGSKNVIELHGTGYRVMCLNCDRKLDRFVFQTILNELNPNMIGASDAIRPDGDVDLSEDQIANFNVPPCSNCGGILKPDIVFFGDNIRREVVETVRNEVEYADSLLILGSSLTTFSGYRIVLQAVDAVKPIAIVNIGKTRADEHADIKISGKCGELFKEIDKLYQK